MKHYTQTVASVSKPEPLEDLAPLIAAIIAQARKDAVAGCPDARAWITDISSLALDGEYLVPTLDRVIDEVELEQSRYRKREYMRQRYHNDETHRQKRKTYGRQYQQRKAAQKQRKG